MHNVLIAHNSEDFAHALYGTLKEKFHVTVCFDGNSALELLRTLKPAILVLDMMLPYKNGLEILQQLHPNIPPIILATTSHHSDSLLQSPAAKYIDYVFLSTCSVNTVTNHIHKLLSKIPTSYHLSPKQEQVAKILLQLQICAGYDGFQQLKTGIPLYASDPGQTLSKELYPEIARLCGYDNGEQVERSIRSAIKTAWKTCNKSLWISLFPSAATKCPSNKVFISRLATYLDL